MPKGGFVSFQGPEPFQSTTTFIGVQSRYSQGLFVTLPALPLPAQAIKSIYSLHFPLSLTLYSLDSAHSFYCHLALARAEGDASETCQRAI